MDSDEEMYYRATVVNPYGCVDRMLRRHGIGSLLFEKGLSWARSLDLRSRMVELQTKNHPGISFAQRYGFGLCGYNDDYYCSGDIALFWSLGLTK